jgi:8-amino-7-oxononanoate synthase
MLSQRLVDQGINVQPIVYPAVADDAARLRFFLSSTHSEEQLSRTADCVRDTLAAVRAEFKV